MLNAHWIHPTKSQIQQFREQKPFPYVRMTAFVSQTDFARLCGQFPEKERFEHHKGIRRWGRQRPHNRYYLALEKNRYQRRKKADDSGPGIVDRSALPEVWRNFIGHLKRPAYARFLEAMLGEKPGLLRFAWHLTYGNCEVSPHLDAPSKLATHIFYFNDERDWQTSWGGETWVLGGGTKKVRNPEFEDFSIQAAIPPLGNASFLFHNKTGAWHGVRPVHCPPGAWRRSFHTIVQRA